MSDVSHTLTYRDAPPPTAHPSPNPLADAFPGKPNWSPSTALPPCSLAGNKAVVTGGYNGIGLETVDALLRASSDVWILGRSETKWQEAVDELKGSRGIKLTLPGQHREEGVGRLAFAQMDLGDLHSVKSAADKYLQEETKLHMLYCSAGVMVPPYGSLTSHSHELQFGTNVLGHHYLITLLLPILLSSKSPAFTPRICLTSSAGHISGSFSSRPAFSPDDPFFELSMSHWLPGYMKTVMQYGNSKMGNVLQAGKLHRTYFTGEGERDGEGGRLIVTSVHPGILKTGLVRNLFPENASLMDRLSRALNYYLVWPLLAYPARYGALNQLYSCTLDDQEALRLGLSGSYVGPWCRLGRADPKSEDKKAQDALWEWCEQEVKKVMG